MERRNKKLVVDTKAAENQTYKIKLLNMTSPRSKEDKSLPRSNSLENIDLSKSQKSPTKRTSKHFDGKSPTKKSVDYLLAKNKGEDKNDIQEAVLSPGNKKFTKDISDVAGKKLPHIPEKEIEEHSLREGLTEVERVKDLLQKKNSDQI